MKQLGRFGNNCPGCGDDVIVEERCSSCGACDCCCECEGELFDADELGLDPEDDEKRKYGDPGVGRELLNEIITLGRRLSALYEGKDA